MHLFIVDLFISLDTVAPIIDGLNKKGQKTKICFVNPMQDFSHHRLIQYLNKSKFNQNHGQLCLGFVNKINYIVLKIIMSLPSFFLNKLDRIWKKIYISKIFFNENNFIKFLKKNDFKSVTIEESLPKNKRKLIINACNKINIPVLCIASGLFTIKMKQDREIYLFKKINFYLSPNLFAPYKKKIQTSKKFLLCGSPRYDTKWMIKLKKIYNCKNALKNKKIKIAYFLRSTSENLNDHLKLIEKIKKIKNIEIKFGNKPREIRPLKSSLFSKDELNTTELIVWSDIVISAPTSILVDSVQRKKITICLEYLTPEGYTMSHFSNHSNVVMIAKSANKAINIINKFNNNKLKSSNTNDRALFLNSFINKRNKNYNIIGNIVKYYLNIKTICKI